MGCKISKEYTLDQGKKNWYMVTGDFGSLQMRLTTQDTTLNPGGQIDPNLFELYSEKSICPDAHSMTGLNTFCKSVGYQMIDFTMDDGKVESIPQDIMVNVRRCGQELCVEAKAVQEGDEFLGVKEE